MSPGYGLKLMMILLLVALSLPCHGAGEEGSPEEGRAAAAPVLEVTVDVYGYPGHKNQIISMATDLIGIKPGREFSQSDLDKAVSLLELSGRFEDVREEVVRTRDGVFLVFHLKPYLQIRDIRISGEYPLFEQDIINAMTVYVGNYLQPGVEQEQADLIRQFLQSEGFIEPRADVRVIDDRGDGTAVLAVDLAKGSYYKLKSLDIRGNRNFSDLRIKSRMSIWERSFFRGSSGRFIEKMLAEDLKDIVSFYWSKRFADATVTQSMRRNPHTGNVHVTITIDEGPKYQVSFPGNESFFGFTLKKELVLFKDGNRGGSGVRKSVRNIRELYRASGYPDVKVRADEEKAQPEGPAARSVAFVIEEGSRVVVTDVQFAGNTAFGESELGDRVRTGNRTIPVFGRRLFNREILGQDVQALQAFYAQSGYAEADVKAEVRRAEDGTSASILFIIAEGPRTVVSSIRFEGLSALTTEEARSCISLKEGSPFAKTALKNDEVSLATCISEKGYPHVQARAAVSLSSDRTRADVSFSISEGQLVHMGRTYFNGNFKTRRRVLQKELGMEPGDPFSLRRMVEGQNEIRSMNIFNAVKFRTLGLKEDRDEVTVLADLEEKKPYYSLTSVGYQSDTGLYGSTRIGDHNLLGLNRDVWLGAEASQVNRRFELGANVPRLLGTRAAGLYNVFWERREDFNQNFGLTTVGYNVGFVRRSSRRLFTSLNFRYEKRNEFIIDEELQAQLDAQKTPEELEDQAEALKPRSIVVVTPSVTYDTRDSFMFPKNGNFSFASIDVSNGLLNSRDIDNFIRYRLDVREYVSPFDRLTFAWIGRAGYLMATNDTNRIPDDQLFYLGGTQSIRGYRENMLLYDVNNNPVGGRLALSSSLEARIRVVDGIELALFYDIGTIQDTEVEPVTPNVRSSYGTGIRYATPIGPLSLLYGRKVSPERAESPYEWHFSLGYTF